ncbi:MAG: Ig-like domain-containing protein [Spirosomataceae bacterium]
MKNLLLKWSLFTSFVGVWLLISTVCIGQTVFWTDDFENAAAPTSGTRTPQTNGGLFGTAPFIAYFMRTDGSDISLGNITSYASKQGTFYWAGEDHDASGGPGELNIVWSNIDISGKTGISFQGLFAANSENGSWDGPNTGGPTTPDYIIVEYAIDAGAYTTLISFRPTDVMCGTLGMCKQISEDTDGNNIGDGTMLTKTFANFSKSISGTGNSLMLRIRVFANGGAEEWAIDNFRLLSGSALTPTATSLNSNNNPSVFGQNVTFTASVSPNTATGTVTFKDGVTTLGSGTLSSGQATFSTSSLSITTHSITAEYGGDGSNAGSTSASLSQAVNCATPTVFSVTGGGSFCSGGTGVVVGLADSEVGVNYQLKNGVNTVGASVPGTNAALSFGLQTDPGTYTVVATTVTGGCTANMTGSATVTVNNLPTLTGANSVSVGSSITLTGSGTPAVANPYTSSNTGVATVNSAGQVTGVSANNAVITYTDINGCQVTKSITVTAALPTVNLSVSANSGSEAGATAITVTATTSQAVVGDQTVSLGVSGTNITAGDYSLSNTTLTILNGQTTGTATFTIVDDALIEGSETAALTISNPSAGITLGSTTTQNITITDNDFPPVNLSVSANSGSEAGATAITVTATTSQAVVGDQTVSLGVSGTNITAGDYSLSNTTITILNGQTTGTATFTIVDDALIEGPETATLTIFNPSAGITLGGTTTQNITITDNDFPQVNLSVSANSGSEAGATAITVTATTSQAVVGDQTVSLGVSGTNITAGDYTLSNTNLTILNGQTTGTATFTIVDDALIEGPETATLTIFNPSAGITLGSTTTQNITITDNDFPPVNLSVSANSGSEAGATAITVTATTSQAVVGDQTVSLGVSGTNITAGDYSLSNTTLTILNGQTTGTATFTIVDDALIEGSETAALTISNPSAGITLGSTTTQNITITDNDFPPVNLSVSANSGSEAGATVITITATASQAVVGNQTVSLGVSGTNITAGDYSLSNTTITILNGQTTGRPLSP